MSSVAEILKKHEKEFFRVVDAKVGLRTLIRTGVITEDVKKEIDDSNKTDAREILYDHLKSHANVDSLLEFCEVAIAAEGLPNMQAFGEKLKKELSPGESPANQKTDAAQSEQSSDPAAMSPWNDGALVALKGKLMLNVMTSTGLNNKLEKPAGGFMDRAEAQSVTRLQGDGPQIERIIDILRGKGDKEFDIFCDMLQKSNNGLWASELKKEAQKLKGQ